MKIDIKATGRVVLLIFHGDTLARVHTDTNDLPAGHIAPMASNRISIVTGPGRLALAKAAGTLLIPICKN